MAKPHEKSLIVALSGAILFLSLSSAGMAQAQRVIPLPPPPTIIWPEERLAEPERWTQEDVTPEQKYETARKESLAAHQEAQNDCKTLSAPERALCQAQARLEFEKEMAEIKARFGVTR